MKNTLLTVAFLAVGSLLFTPTQSSAVGICGCNNVAAGYCYKGPPGVPNPCARVGICGCVIEKDDGGYCGDATSKNPCLDEKYAEMHRYE